MIINQQQKNWLLDAGLWAGFVALFFLDLTGVELHQWLGIGVGLLAGSHLIRHGKWVKAVTQRLFGKTSPQARVYYLLDAGILAGFMAILVSGLAISTWLNLSLESYDSWQELHGTGSIVTLGLLVAKIGLHRRWIIKTVQDMLHESKISGKTPALQPVPVADRVSRRHFLNMMGVVGLSAGAALLNTQVPGAAGSTIEEDPTSQVSASEDQSSSLAVIPLAQSSSACTVRCNKRCSYPGHCRRYVDSNRNGRCDLGECV